MLSCLPLHESQHIDNHTHDYCDQLQHWFEKLVQLCIRSLSNTSGNEDCMLSKTQPSRSQKSELHERSVHSCSHWNSLEWRLHAVNKQQTNKQWMGYLSSSHFFKWFNYMEFEHLATNGGYMQGIFFIKFVYNLPPKISNSKGYGIIIESLSLLSTSKGGHSRTNTGNTTKTP